MTSLADLPTPKNELVKCVRFYLRRRCFVESGSPSPTFRRGGGEVLGGGWVGWDDKKRRKERKTKTKKKKKNVLSRKRYIKSVCCNVSHRKHVFSQTKWKQKLQTETATAAKSILF